jgi:hypothetical protein
MVSYGLGMGGDHTHPGLNQSGRSSKLGLNPEHPRTVQPMDANFQNKARGRFLNRTCCSARAFWPGAGSTLNEHSKGGSPGIPLHPFCAGGCSYTAVVCTLDFGNDSSFLQTGSPGERISKHTTHSIIPPGPLGALGTRRHMQSATARANNILRR